MQVVLRYGIWAGLFAVLFIPLIVAEQFFFPFITGKNFTFRIIVGIIFALWLILILTDKDARPKGSALWYALLLFVGALGISALLGENPHKSLWSNFERMEGWISLVHLGAYFTVLVSMVKTEKMWRALLNTSIAVSVIIALYGVLQLAGIFTINQGGVRVDGTFGNATYLAAYMLFHAFFTLYALYRFNPARWLQLGYALAFVLQLCMIFYAATRGTTLGLLGGLFVAGAIFLFFSQGKETLRKAGAALMIGIIFLAGGFYFIKDNSFVRENDVLGRFASINLEEGETRFTIWGMAIQGALERPLFGWGQEGFNYVFNKYYEPSLYAQEPWFDRAHNQFLDWLVAGGFIGFFLYVSLYACAVLYLFRGNFDVGERAILGGLLAGYAFHSMFVFDNLMSSVLFLTLLAFITARYSSEKEPLSFPTLSGSAHAISSAVIVCILAVAMYVVNVPGMARASGLITALSPQPGGLEDNLRAFEEVIGDSGLGRQEAHEQLLQFATQVRRPELAQFATEDLRTRIVTFTEDRFGEEVSRQPNDARLRLFYGSFLRQVGDQNGAREQMLRALELSPQKQTILFELGLLASEAGNGAEALQRFEEAFTLNPENDQARLFLVTVLFRLGEVARADQLLVERYGTVTPPQEILLNTYFDIKNIERLVLVAEARVGLLPGELVPLTQLAGAYLEAGRREDAILVLERAIEMHPNFSPQGAGFIEQIRSGEL